MDQSVRLLLGRIQSQLDAVLRDSGRDVSAPRESWALNSRSPDRQKLDESGISSEEGCIPQQVYSQLTDIVSLVRDLETALDLSHTGTDSCSKTLSDSGGGDFAREEAENERMLEWHDRPLVYSRSSAQLLPAGCTPNLEVVVLKDTRVSRRAEVVVKPPSEQDPAGDRKRTRPVLPRRQFGTVNYVESFSSLSDFSSSSEDDRDTSGSRTRGERRKKRVRCRGTQQIEKKKIPRARHASDSKVGGGKFIIADFVVSSTDVGGTRRGSEVEEMDGDWGARVVQMECEIGGEEQGPPLPPLLSSSPALNTPSPSSTTVNAGNTNLSKPYLLENASWLTSSQNADVSHSGQATLALARREESIVVTEKIVKPCSVRVTSLPRHTVLQYLSAVSVDEPSSTAVESLGSNEDLPGGKQLTSLNRSSKEEKHQEREDSVSTSGESFSSSESESMLGPTQTPAGCGLKSGSGERGVSGGSISVGQRTPRRLGSGGKSPVARRSFPFSKPPSTPTLPTPSPTPSMVKPAHSTTPYKPPKLKSVSPSKLRLSLSKSPSPSKISFKSPSPSNLSPASSKSVTPTQNPSSPSSFSSPSPSESPSSPPPDPLPPTSISPVTPTNSSNTIHATPSKPTKTGGSSNTKKSSPPTTKSTPSRSRQTHTNSKSSRRKDSRSTALDQTLAVDWSIDDDFKADPSPSLVISPTARNQKVTSSLPATVKTESSGDSSPVKPTPLLATMPPSPQSSSQVLRQSDSPINDESLTTGAAVDEEGEGEEEGSPKGGPPAVKAHAHSLSGNTAESGIDEGGSSLPGVISCAGCSRPIHWKTEPIHKHERLDILICQACWNVYNTGSFEMSEGKEIYCMLCGDGGDIISCDRASCTSSLCQSCIRRIAGEQSLQRILDDESIVWECFCCNTSPLVHYRSLCSRLCQYYERDQQRKKSGFVKGKARLFSDTDSDRVARGVSSGVKVKEVKGEMVGRGGEGVSGESSGERRSHSGGREERRGREGEGDKGDKGTGEEPGTRGEGGGGGDRKRPNKKRREVETSESDVDSSSCDGEDSPKVDTDDVSISDSSLFEGDVSSLKRVGGASSCKTSALSTGSKSSAKPAGEKNRAKGSPESTNKQVKKKKKGRVSVGGSAHRTVFSSDSDSDFETPVKKTSPQRRRVASSSSSASNESGKKEGETREKRPKRNVLLDVLSSGSEENESPQKVSVKEPPSDARNGSDSEPHSPALSLPSNQPESPVVYATPRKLHAALSSDSDDDMTVLERRQKRGHVLGSDTSSGNGEDKQVSNKSDSPGEEKAAKMKKLQRGKRRKRGDSSGEEFLKGEIVVRGPKLKRRRVARAIMSDSDSSDSVSSGGEEEEEDEDEEKSTPGRKRKKIRRVMTDAKLQSTTKEAQRAERERIERLKKRQSLGKEKDELILETDPVSKKAVIQVRQSLVEPIKPHQWEGIRFLYDACVEKLEMFREGKTRAGGAILAHCMGLGKTLQVIALIDALLMHQDSGVSRVLILSPVNTIYNWRNEFYRWIDPIDCRYNVYMLVDTSVEARVRKLERWFTGGGIIFIGYELFRNLVMGKRLRKKKREAFEKYLLDPGPDIIVCDEGHVMRNASSILSIVLQRVRTRARIVLTGTPLQNNLVEYHTMVSFVKPNLLGTLKEFKNRFANPITNGQCRDSTPSDVRVMKNRAHILHEMLSGTVQRRDYRVLARFLPPKQEFVLFMRLSPVQESLYTHYLNNKSSGCHTASDLFSTFSNLQKVWNHPWVLKLDEDRRFEREERRRLYEESEEDSLDGFIVTGSEEEEEERGRRRKNKESKVESVGRASSSGSSPVGSVTPGPSRATLSPETNQNLPTSTTMLGSSDEDDVTLPAISLKPDPDAPPPPKRVTRSTKPPSEEGDRGDVISPTNDKPPSHRSSSPPQWYDDLLTPDCEASAGVSGKIQFLLELLEETGKLKEKVLVFTQSLLTLDLIEEVLGRPVNGEWTPGLDYYRLDGSTRSEMRTHQMSHFNEFDNEQLRLYLISTRAGSLGVNLVAANRVVIFDACWNPSHDLQAVFRSYRFGQMKPIFVYRLLAQGTMEEKIYDRQVTKESLAMRVVDEKQVGRHYNASDLAELFTYSPAPPAPPPDQRPTYDRPEADMVLSSILGRLQPDWIINYHEHDSLLKHVFSEELSEEERKAAWDDYRAQIAQYDNATYYSALQNQLDTATAGGSSLQQAVGQSSLPSASGVKNEGGILNHALQQQQRQHQLQAAQLLTILSNTNRNVENLISLLHEKASIGAQHADNVRRGVRVPTALAVKMALNNKNISEHYALVDQGVTRVNSTLHKCHLGQIYLEPGVHKQANEQRAKLITNLEILKSGSKNPHRGLAAVPHQPHVGGGAGSSSTSGVVPRQFNQQQVLQQLQAEVHRKLGVGGGPSS